MKGRKYAVVFWEGPKYISERLFWGYHEAYRYCQEHLKSLAEDGEFLLDDGEDECYYAEHYFLVAELYKLTERIDVFEQKVWDKERSLWFYWSGRRIVYSPGNKAKFTWERIRKIEEALHKGQNPKELLKVGG